jgi:hypothetical protein
MTLKSGALPVKATSRSSTARPQKKAAPVAARYHGEEQSDDEIEPSVLARK